MKKTYQGHRQGLYFIFRTPMKGERLATAAIEDRLNQKNPHGFHQVQRQDHPVMYIAQARHQRPQAQRAQRHTVPIKVYAPPAVVDRTQ